MQVPFQGKCRGKGLRGLILVQAPISGLEQPSQNAELLIEEGDDGSRYPRRMDVAKVLAALRAERELIEKAILTLERLAGGRRKRRGRPRGSKNKPKENPRSDTSLS